MAKLKLADQSRGLDELLGSSDSVTDIVKELTHTIVNIPLDQIEVNPWQPRKDFDENALQELSDSIKIYGLIQPITLRRLATNQFQLISGERRLQASHRAGLRAIPAYIRIANDQEMLEMALVENLLREDLNAIEVANTYQRLKDEFFFTDEQLGKRVDRNRSTVTNMLRLLKLPPAVQQSIKDKRISTGHAKVLVGIKDVMVQLSLHNEIVEKHLSVRELEDLVVEYSKSNTLKQKKAPPSVPDAYKPVVDNLNAFFGSKVAFTRKETGAGHITIKFKNDDDLNRILDRIEENK